MEPWYLDLELEVNMGKFLSIPVSHAGWWLIWLWLIAIFLNAFHELYIF